MSELLVYKASAGSGKTFTLAVEYIKLFLVSCTVFRQETKDPKPISTVSKKKREKQSRKYGKQQTLPLVICYTTTVGFG